MKITRPPPPSRKTAKDLEPGTVFEVIGGIQGNAPVLMRLRGDHHDIGVPCVNLALGVRVDIRVDALVEVLDAELVIK